MVNLGQSRDMNKGIESLESVHGQTCRHRPCTEQAGDSSTQQRMWGLMFSARFYIKTVKQIVKWMPEQFFLLFFFQSDIIFKLRPFKFLCHLEVSPQYVLQGPLLEKNLPIMWWDDWVWAKLWLINSIQVSITDITQERLIPTIFHRIIIIIIQQPVGRQY